MLYEVITALKSRMREEDSLARWGGEEFLFLLHNAEEEEAAVGSERMRETVEALSVSFEGRGIRVTMSFGVASWTDDIRTVDDLIKRADNRLVITSYSIHYTKLYELMVNFIFNEPAVPPVEDIVPKRLDAAKTREVLIAAKEVISKIGGLGEEEADGLFRATAESLGVKLGDLMMPIRMAVTGSRVSPPLVGSIQVIGPDKANERIDRAVRERFS